MAQPATKATAHQKSYLSLVDIAELLDIGQTSAHELVAEPWWPAAIELRTRVHRWIRSEVEAALATRAPRRTTRIEPPQLARTRGESPRGSPGAAIEPARCRSEEVGA